MSSPVKIYLAPLEGVTTFVFRKRFYECFGEQVDKYYTPFFAPHSKRPMKSKEVKEILPENNPGFYLVPQLLTDSAKDALSFQKDMKRFGYDEININAGCPSGTVTKKSRGSGMLLDTRRLDDFLYELYEKSEGIVSVKTRIGFSDSEEWESIWEVYKKYPISELIIHPRTREQFYGGNVFLKCFEKAYNESPFPLVYNGDIRTIDDYNNIIKLFPKQEAIMIGRGAIADPSVVRSIKNGSSLPYKMEEILGFLEGLLADYSSLYGADEQTLFKIKEVWSFMKIWYPDRDVRNLMKAKTISEFSTMQRNVIKNNM